MTGMSSPVSEPETQTRFPKLKTINEWWSRRILTIPSDGIVRPRPTTILVCSLIIFFLAVGVRLLHWQDSHVRIVSGAGSLAGVFDRYSKEAERMIEDRSVLFPRERPTNGDARMLVHPPGYAMLLAAILKLSNNPYPLLWIVQIIADALAAVCVFLIAIELLPMMAALIGGLLVALSPHLAYYSLILSPDSLPILPILLAIYLIILAMKRPRLLMIILAGVLIGLSCWLRANALALAPFLALLVFGLFQGRQRWHYALALLLATIVVVAPITIRNLIIFHHFIPISIAAGENLAEGIGNYDPEGKLGMPRSDREQRVKDVEWSGRADYGGSLWSPDGIERDHMRWNRAVGVIRSRPVWFLGVMLRRAGFMLRYNDSRDHEFPFSTAVVPVVSVEPGFSNPLVQTGDRQPQWMNLPAVVVVGQSVLAQSLAVNDEASPVWSTSPNDLMAQGAALTSQTAIALDANGQSLHITGDNSAYGDQFVSAPIDVEKNTDYVLTVPARLLYSDVAIKVTSADRRITLGSMNLLATPAERKRKSADSSEGVALSTFAVALQLAFASGNRTQICLVISNNSTPSAMPEVRIGTVSLFKMGATPAIWTRLPRSAVRSIQRNLFTTAHLLPLVILGVVLMLIAGQWRIMAILLAVPLYYLSAQSVLSTEYRYILGIHYFLFIFAGVMLSSLLALIWAGASRLIAKTRRNIGSQAKGDDRRQV
jgi:hypothetical protein